MTPELWALGAQGLGGAGGGAPWPGQPPSPPPPPPRARPFKEEACGLFTFTQVPRISQKCCLGFMPETSNTNNFQFAWEFNRTTQC